MDDYVDTAVLRTEDRFAIGQPVSRSEDPVLLRNARTGMAGNPGI